MNLSHAEDETLAVMAGQGRKDAFEALVHRYAGALEQVLEQRCLDHHLARDLSQEVWLKVYRALPRFRPVGTFRSWLFSIAFNHSRDVHRRRKKAPLLLLEDVDEPGQPQVATLQREVDERRPLIEQALQRVAEPYRSALVLIDVQGLSYEEASRTLECAVGTVKSRVNRGRFAFREAYERAANHRDTARTRGVST